MFPVLHGPFGEDGTVQGLLECLDVPYVGAGVLASALCMDKVMFKELMAHAGDPAGRLPGGAGVGVGFRPREAALGRSGGAGPAGVRQAGAARLVGRDRPRRERRRAAGGALEVAFEHDSLAIVEAAATGLEVECSVIGNDEPIASQPGEILLAAGEAGWYDYEAKYTPGGMELIVPARVPDAVRERVRELAVRGVRQSPAAAGWRGSTSSSRASRCSSTSSTRCPASRSTSVFAALFEASGVPYAELLDRLVELALERHEAEGRHRH